MKLKYRKPFTLIVLLLVLAAFLVPLQGYSAEVSPLEIAEKSNKIDYNESNGLLYINDELVVFLGMDSTHEEVALLLERQDAQADDSMADIGVYRLMFQESMTYEELMTRAAKIEEESIVDSVHLSILMEMASTDTGAAVYPNDPWKRNFWQKKEAWDTNISDGKNWGMEAIDAPEAWQYLDQMSTVKVGIIDSRPDLSHPDLTFVNAQCLKIDENGNFTEVDPETVSADDHGTHVAGIMAAKWNNGEGVSGIMGGKGELYSYTIDMDEDLEDSILYSGYITGYSYLQAVKALLDQDVQVINISQGGEECAFAASHGNQAAIDYITRQAELAEEVLTRIIAQRQQANRPDFVICIAAGNLNDDSYIKDDNAILGYRKENNWETIQDFFGKELENEVYGGVYAKYSHFLNLIETPEIRDRIIVVGAVKIRTKASTETSTQYGYTDFSNIGSRVDLVAPGSRIFSCTVNGYGNKSGTSMAAPHVSGVAGLIFACNPSLSGPEVKEILLASTTGEYDHDGGTSGMVNAHLAVVSALKTLETDEEIPPEVTEEIPPETVPENAEQNDIHKLYVDFLRENCFVDYIVNDIIRDVCRSQHIDNYYIFRDLDYNGVDDLILWLGYTGADGEILTFTVDNGAVRYTGSAACDGTGTAVFCSDHDADFFLASYDGYETYAEDYRFVYGMLMRISTDAVIPHRWYALEQDGSLPIESEPDDPAPDTAADTDEIYTAFLEHKSYIMHVTNPLIFDSWMAGETRDQGWIEDINNDGTDELIIWIGCGDQNGEVLVFSAAENELVYLGSVQCYNGTGISISGSDTVSGFLIVSNDGMLESLTKCEILDGFLTAEENYMITESGWYALEPIG